MGMGMPRVRCFRVRRPGTVEGLSRSTGLILHAMRLQGGRLVEVPVGLVIYGLETSTLYYTSLGGRLDSEFEGLASRLFSLGLLVMPPFDDIEGWRKYDYMTLWFGGGIVKPFRWDEQPRWFLYGIAHKYMGIAAKGVGGLEVESFRRHFLMRGGASLDEVLECPDVRVYRANRRIGRVIVELDPPIYDVRPVRVAYDDSPEEAVRKAYGRLLEYCRGMNEEMRREEIRRLKSKLSPEERRRLEDLIIRLAVPRELQLQFVREYVQGRIRFKGFRDE